MKDSNKNSPLLFKVENCLGPLELEVMFVLWQRRKAKVSEVLDVLKPKKRFAYTTIMTVMDKLHKKGFLKREKIGKAYCYSPVFGQNQVISNSLSLVFKDLGVSYGRKKVLAATLALVPTFSSKLIKTYKKSVLTSFSFAIVFALFIYSLFDLLKNLSFFGIFDYLNLLTVDAIANHNRLLFYALLENLPVINLASSLVLLILTVIFTKKLFKLIIQGRRI